MKITKDSVAGVPLPEGKTDHFVWDDDLKGFGVRLRLGPDGKTVTRSLVVQWKHSRSSRRLRLGAIPPLTVKDARAAAEKILAKVALGEDPAAEKAERRAKEARTMRAMVTEYLADKRDDWAPRTYVEIERYLTDPCYFGPLHRMSLTAIELRDVAARLKAIKRESGNAAVFNARAALSAFFVWCLKAGLCTANPVINSDAGKIEARDRVVTPDELSKIWKACGDDHYGKIIKLLICTACRRQEIGDMRFSEIDFERGTFMIPKERAKTGKVRVIPLLPMIAEIIKDVPRMASRDYLFGERGPHGFTAWSACKRELDARVGFSNFVVHDFRRAAATIMSEELGIQPHIVELVLGHEFRSGVQGTYNRARYARDIRDAYLRWHDYLTTLIEGGERKVVSFPQPVRPSA
jgi:integrase